MLVDIKGQIKAQQAQFDRDWEKAALNSKNVIREQETLKKLNN